VEAAAKAVARARTPAHPEIRELADSLDKVLTEEVMKMLGTPVTPGYCLTAARL